MERPRASRTVKPRRERHRAEGLPRLEEVMVAAFFMRCLGVRESESVCYNSKSFGQGSA